MLDLVYNLEELWGDSRNSFSNQCKPCGMERVEAKGLQKRLNIDGPLYMTYYAHYSRPRVHRFRIRQSIPKSSREGRHRALARVHGESA